MCMYSLAAEEEEVQPQPSEDQHDDGDREAEDEPCAKVYHLCIWISPGWRKADTNLQLVMVLCVST